jgi:hypothetical protein
MQDELAQEVRSLRLEVTALRDGRRTARADQRRECQSDRPAQAPEGELMSLSDATENALLALIFNPAWANYVLSGRKLQ